MKIFSIKRLAILVSFVILATFVIAPFAYADQQSKYLVFLQTDLNNSDYGRTQQMQLLVNYTVTGSHNDYKRNYAKHWASNGFKYRDMHLNYVNYSAYPTATYGRYLGYVKPGGYRGWTSIAIGTGYYNSADLDLDVLYAGDNPTYAMWSVSITMP